MNFLKWNHFMCKVGNTEKDTYFLSTKYVLQFCDYQATS